MADAFNNALQWLRRAFNAHQDNLEELDIRWVALEEIFETEVESGQRTGTFAQWVHTSHAVSKQHVELVMRYYYTDGYEKLRPKVRAPLEAVAAHWKTSVWDIYFTFYQEVAQSRLALLAIRKLQRHKPDLKMLDVLVAAQTARAQRKKDNTRGVRTDTNTFFNWDIQSAVQALYGEATPPTSPQSSSSIHYNSKRKQIATFESPSKRRRSSSVEFGRNVSHPDPGFDDSLLRGSPGFGSLRSNSRPAEWPSPAFLGSSYGDVGQSDGEDVGALNNESIAEYGQEMIAEEDTGMLDKTHERKEEPSTPNNVKNIIDIEHHEYLSSQNYSSDADDQEERSGVEFVDVTEEGAVFKDIERHNSEHKIHDQLFEATGKASEAEPEEDRQNVHEHNIKDDDSGNYPNDTEQDDDRQTIHNHEKQDTKHVSNEQEDVEVEEDEQLTEENRQHKLSDEDKVDDGLYKPKFEDNAGGNKLHIPLDDHGHAGQNNEEPDNQQNDGCGQAEAATLSQDQNSIAPDMPMTPKRPISLINIGDTPTAPFESPARLKFAEEHVFDQCAVKEEVILHEQKHGWGSRCLMWMSITIRANDIATLAPGNMVNDEIVNFCLDRSKLLYKQRQALTPTRERVEIFNTFFYPKILSTLGKPADEARMISRWGSWGETTDHLVIPINIQNYHWYFAVVSDVRQLRSPDGVRSTYITIIDSLGAGKERHGEHSEVVVAIQTFLSLKCKHWNLAIRPESIGFRTSCNVPLQRNGTDCGIFLIELVARFILDPRAFLFNAQYLNWSPRIDATKTRRWIERQIWTVWLTLNTTQASTRTVTTVIHPASEIDTATNIMQPIPWRAASESIIERMIVEAAGSDQVGQFSVEKCFAAFFLDTLENVTWSLDQPLCLVQSRKDIQLVYKLPRENLLYTVYDILPMHHKLVETDDEFNCTLEQSSPTSAQHVSRLSLISKQILSHREILISLSSLVNLLEVTRTAACQVENPFTMATDHSEWLISRYRNDIKRLNGLECTEMRKIFAMMMHNKIKEAEAEVAYISQMEASLTQKLTAGRERLDKRIEAAKREQTEVSKILKLLESNLWAESEEKAERIRDLRKELEGEEGDLVIMKRILEDRVYRDT